MVRVVGGFLRAREVNELLCHNLWATIKRLAKRATTKRAAVAYITSDELVKFADGDVLITDASESAIASGQTNAKVLARVFKRGARLYSLRGLHTKVYLLGGTVVIGSANLSATSANDLIEAAWVTDAPTAVGMATSLVQQLTVQAERIDETFLRQILKIKVKRHPAPGGRSAKPKRVRIPKHRTWIVGVKEILKDLPAEQEAIEAGTAAAKQMVTKSSSDVSWIRWTGHSRFRSEAKEGDSVIQIWSSYRAKRPTAVYRHAPILHRQEENTCTRFFVEDFADMGDTCITWIEFKKIVGRVGLIGKIGPASAREITEPTANALFSLWRD
jgi:hypothetical protein